MFQIRLGGICGVVRTTSAELHAWWCEHPLKGGVEMQAMDVAPLANGYLSQLFVVTVVDVLNDVGVVPLCSLSLPCAECCPGVGVYKSKRISDAAAANMHSVNVPICCTSSIPA
jgi:hypothetical protein